MIERDKRRKLYQGTSNGMTRAFELAVAPLIFGLVGYGLDRAFGITPVLTIVFLLVGFGGTVVKLWYGYDREMQAHDRSGAWKSAPSVSERKAS